MYNTLLFKGNVGLTHNSLTHVVCKSTEQCTVLFINSTIEVFHSLKVVTFKQSSKQLIFLQTT